MKIAGYLSFFVSPMLYSRILDSFFGPKCGLISGLFTAVCRLHASRFFHSLLSLPLLRFLPDLL